MQPVPQLMALDTALPATYSRSSLSWGKIFLLLLTIVLVSRIQEVIPGLAPLRIGLVTGMLAGLAWVVAAGSFQEKIPTQIKQIKYLLMLLALAVVTVPLSVWPTHSVEFITDTFLKIVVFFLLVIFWCKSVQDVRHLIWACCLGVSAVVVLGLALGNAEPGRFQSGTQTYDPNDLAFVLTMALPLLVYLFTVSGLLLRCVVIGVAASYLYGIVLTQSRGGFLGLLIVGFLILRRSTLSWTGKMAIAVFAVVVVGSLAGNEYWDRMSTIWSPETEYDATGGGRTEIWKTGLRLLVTHPWGVGINCFDVAEGLTHEGLGKWNAAHNAFLQVGVELGVLGLIVFVLLLGRTIKDLRNIQSVQTVKLSGTNLRRGLQSAKTIGVTSVRDQLPPLASALETSLWGFVAGCFFLSQAYSAVLYCVLALSLACKRIYIDAQQTTFR